MPRSAALARDGAGRMGAWSSNFRSWHALLLTLSDKRVERLHNARRHRSYAAAQPMNIAADGSTS